MHLSAWNGIYKGGFFVSLTGRRDSGVRVKFAVKQHDNNSEMTHQWNAITGARIFAIIVIAAVNYYYNNIIIIIIIIINNACYYGGAITKLYAAGPPYSVKWRNHKLAVLTVRCSAATSRHSASISETAMSQS